MSRLIFKALACDYDGTLASEDRIGTRALAALGGARAAGLRLVLVTGRTFFELTRVCERLDLFDAVVAENGGVLYFPREGMIRDEAPPPPPRLLAELDRRGIVYQVGRVVISTARSDEGSVREALAATGVSLERVENRAALMLLPAGVSKGTGVRQVLRRLGLSFHDVLGLGDAENDLDLFEACGFSGCPGSAVPGIRERADWIFPGDDGQAIAQALEGPILGGRLPVERSPRHRVGLGWAAGTSEPVFVAARGVNLLIHGDPLSGKSWLAGALVERLSSRRYAVCVIDPEGDYGVLAGLPSVTGVEVGSEATLTQALDHLVRDPSACVVANLSALAHRKKMHLIEEALDRMRHLRDRAGVPHWIVLDEAHYSLHQDGIREEAIGFAQKGFCLVTYKSSWLRASVVKGVDVFVLARTSVPEELAFLRSLLGDSARGGERAMAVLPNLPPGEFVLVHPGGVEAPGPLTFTATPRQTSHVRHRGKYADSRVPPERRFFFRQPGGQPTATADSINGFRQVVERVPPSVLAYHAARGDFSRWVVDVFSDEDLGIQLRKLETRWGRGEIPDLREALLGLIAFRYGPER